MQKNGYGGALLCNFIAAAMYFRKIALAYRPVI